MWEKKGKYSKSVVLKVGWKLELPGGAFKLSTDARVLSQKILMSMVRGVAWALRFCKAPWGMQSRLRTPRRERGNKFLVTSCLAGLLNDSVP